MAQTQPQPTMIHDESFQNTLLQRKFEQAVRMQTLKRRGATIEAFLSEPPRELRAPPVATAPATPATPDVSAAPASPEREQQKSSQPKDATGSLNLHLNLFNIF
jgi:hypothetical protein